MCPALGFTPRAPGVEFCSRNQFAVYVFVLELRQLNLQCGQHVLQHLLAHCLCQTVCNIVLRTDFSQPYFLVRDSILQVSALDADVTRSHRLRQAI